MEFAIFKGVIAEQRWYDRVGERPCWDLDILLAPSQLGRIDEIVSSLQPGHALAGVSQRLFERGFIQGLTLWVDETPIDLHFDLFKLGLKSRLAETVWQRVVWQDAAQLKGPVRTLDAETSLLHFLIHLGRDRFSRLLGHVDIARIIEREELDWAVIETMARQEGLDAPVSVAVTALSATLAIPLPTVRTSGWRKWIWGFLWRSEIRLQGEVGRHRFRRRGKWLLPLTVRGRSVEAVRWWLKTVVPPAALLDERHPGLRGPYLWRLVAGRFRFWRRQRRQRKNALGNDG